MCVREREKKMRKREAERVRERGSVCLCVRTAELEWHYVLNILSTFSLLFQFVVLMENHSK